MKVSRNESSNEKSWVRSRYGGIPDLQVGLQGCIGGGARRRLERQPLYKPLHLRLPVTTPLLVTPRGAAHPFSNRYPALPQHQGSETQASACPVRNLSCSKRLAATIFKRNMTICLLFGRLSSRPDCDVCICGSSRSSNGSCRTQSDVLHQLSQLSSLRTKAVFKQQKGSAVSSVSSLIRSGAQEVEWHCCWDQLPQQCPVCRKSTSGGDVSLHLLFCHSWGYICRPGTYWSWSCREAKGHYCHSTVLTFWQATDWFGSGQLRPAGVRKLELWHFCWFVSSICKPGVYRMEPAPHVVCIVPDGSK